MLSRLGNWETIKRGASWNGKYGEPGELRFGRKNTRYASAARRTALLLFNSEPYFISRPAAILNITFQEAGV